MRYRVLGRTGLRVSEISLGTVELGLDYGIAAHGETLRPSREDAGRLLHRALDLGVNLIDTARAYGDSEEIIGHALAARRREYHLCTKVQAVPARMEASISESLRMLRTEAVDLLLLHSANSAQAEDEQVREALTRARDRGQARFLGASVYGPLAARAAILSGLYDCVQVAWSALDRRVESDVLALAQEHGVGLMIRSVLMRGALTHRMALLPDALQPIREAAQRLERIAAGAGMDLPELAYRYVLSHPGPLSALVGTGRAAEIEAALNYSEKGVLDPDVIDAVRAVDVADQNLLDISRWPA